MILISHAFEHEEVIPAKYTCDGENISPDLEWSDVPSTTKSFVLICDDPDATNGTWNHWIIFNLSSHISFLPEAISALPHGTKRGKNSWGMGDYGGPCPPSGSHRYFFRLYALDAALDLDEGATKDRYM